MIDREGFLGEGSYSICRRCRNRRTQEEFAVKIVSLRQEVDAQNEIELLRICQGHANIVKLHEVYSDEVRRTFKRRRKERAVISLVTHVYHHGIAHRGRIVLSDSHSDVVFRERSQSVDEKARLGSEFHA